MNELKEYILNYALLAANKCQEYVKSESDGLLHYIDPNDGIEISAHYGASHAATAFIILGALISDHQLYDKGLELMRSVLGRWNKSKRLPAFHADFNNFALSLAYDYISDNLVKSKIKECILSTEDSNHKTINWLPMRWLVNIKRLEWTEDIRYLKKSKECECLINSATNPDGGIEDRLPLGTSFNLQYDISTVAELLLLKQYGIQQDLSKEIGFLKNAVLPDGDINYQGRGCNQIFAWGPWIYINAASSNHQLLSQSLDYLSSGDKVRELLNNDNLILNDTYGRDKMWWWDYHYASVYIAHFLLWLVLAYRDIDKSCIIPSSGPFEATGLHVKRFEGLSIAYFDGRKEYLAEAGPNISAIWRKKQGVIFKGTFGPWHGLFGNKYIIEDLVLNNFIGLLKVYNEHNLSNCRITRRLLKYIHVKPFLKKEPLFLPFSIKLSKDKITVIWKSDKPVTAIFNAAFCVNDIDLQLVVDNKCVPLLFPGTFINQYGKRYLCQSHKLIGTEWALTIKFTENA